MKRKNLEFPINVKKKLLKGLKINVCHLSAPNVKDKRELLIYKYYFLRFSSFKEASQYYGVNNRFELHIKIAEDIAKITEKNINNSFFKIN